MTKLGYTIIYELSIDCQDSLLISTLGDPLKLGTISLHRIFFCNLLNLRTQLVHWIQLSTDNLGPVF